jgi:outer membrane receptor protein involved in Fe transport
MAMHALRRALFCGLVSAVCSMTAIGQSGKVSGIITDRATREPLVGANVSIVGTAAGGSTNAQGEYFVLHVPPGVYTLRVGLMGYHEATVKNVKVSIDLTTRISVMLDEQSVDIGEEVVITAERPVIQKDATSSTLYVDASQISALPVADAREGVLLQSGVFFDPIPVEGGLGGSGRGETRYAVRGGTQAEVKWFYDGVRTAALIEGRADRGGSYTGVNLNAVQEIQVLTGGFSAEYGDAQSGIVNVVTKEGGSAYNGSVEYIHGFSGQHHFGSYLYDQATQKEFLDHTMADGSLDPTWWTPYRQSQVYDYTKIPDHTVYMSFGGPLYQGADGKGSFFLSAALKREAYTFPHPRDTRDNENLMGNLSFQLQPDMKLRITGLYAHENHSTLQEYGDFVQQAKYYRGWGSLLETHTYSGSAQLTHTLSPSLFYEAKLSAYLFDSKERPSDYIALGESKNPDIWGYQRYDGYPNEPFDEYSYLVHNHLQTGDVSLTGSASWQADQANLIKAGIEFHYNTLAELQVNRQPSFSDDPALWLNRGLHETYHPIQLSAYLQDKMEFESMILNLGVRYDYINPNRDWFWGYDLYNLSIDPEYKVALDPDRDQIDSNGHIKYSFENVLKKQRTPSPAYHMVSPRLGVSFPITENTVLRFNYGHFYQMPPLDWMYEFNYFRPLTVVKAIQAELQKPNPGHVASNDGDPERVVLLTNQPLKPMKTVSFEAGIKHNFGDIMVLDVVGFYKDVTDQTYSRQGIFDRRIYGYDPFIKSTTSNTFYTSLLSGDYGDAQGFEVTLRSLFSNVMMFDLNYSFSRSLQGRASPARVNYDSSGIPAFVYDTDVNKRIPVETHFSRPHIVRANVLLRYPHDATPSLLTAILRDASVSILYRFTSGQTFTYLDISDAPDTYDNQRYPPSHNVDLRIEKALHLGGTHEVTLSLRVTNLFNTKNVRSLGDIYYDANAMKKFVETGEVSLVDGAGYDISWQTWYEARRFYASVRYVF